MKNDQYNKDVDYALSGINTRDRPEEETPTYDGVDIAELLSGVYATVKGKAKGVIVTATFPFTDETGKVFYNMLWNGVEYTSLDAATISYAIEEGIWEKIEIPVPKDLIGRVYIGKSHPYAGSTIRIVGGNNIPGSYTVQIDDDETIPLLDSVIEFAIVHGAWVEGVAEASVEKPKICEKCIKSTTHKLAYSDLLGDYTDATTKRMVTIMPSKKGITNRYHVRGQHRSITRHSLIKEISLGGLVLWGGGDNTPKASYERIVAEGVKLHVADLWHSVCQRRIRKFGTRREFMEKYVEAGGGRRLTAEEVKEYNL